MYSNKGSKMIKFIVGFVLGIAVSTVGFSGLAKMADKGVTSTQTIVKDAAK
jgi:hypothetical protein